MSSNSPSLRLSDSGAGGTLELFDAWGTALEPAPITPTDSSAYQLLSGTILATHVNSVIPSTLDKDMIVAPGLAGGNTGVFLSVWTGYRVQLLLTKTLAWKNSDRYTVLLESDSAYLPL